MGYIENQEQENTRIKESLFRSLDRGIDDMEAKRELPIKEAFDKITELRSCRRNARI